MILGEILRLSLSSLAANKLRSFLTMLGIAIGVFSVIGVMTVIGGLKSGIDESLKALGGNSFQIAKYPAFNFSDPRRRFMNRKDITYLQATRFKEMMGEHAEVSAILDRGGRRVFFKDRNTNPDVSMVGGDENSAAASSFDIAAGRGISSEDVEVGRAVVVLGADLVKRLFPDQDPLGETVRIDGQNYTVIGRFVAKGTSFGGSQDNLVFIPITQYLETYGRWRQSVRISIKAFSQTEFGDAQDRAVGVMRLVRGLQPEDGNDFEIFTNDSIVEAIGNVTGGIAIGAFIISAIALLAAGVGVMNIMLVSVTERTKEIGIRKSIGAKKKNILAQFLIEAVTISILGGLFGILLGAGIGNLIFWLMSGSLVFPWFWAMIGVLVCGGIGIGFGIYPAWRAANLDPIEALRFE